MKPIVFYDVEKYDNDDNVLLINKVSFDKLIDDVYKAGYEDGQKDNKGSLYYPNNTRDFKPDWVGTQPTCDTK